jgi:multisubunit Na+/H+ antiporter MnhF subunit
MNVWLIASAVLLLALAPCGIAAFHGSPMERLLGLEMAGVVEVMFLVTFALALNRSNFLDLALAMALLCFGGGLVFARFLERWL